VVSDKRLSGPVPRETPVFTKPPHLRPQKSSVLLSFAFDRLSRSRNISLVNKSTALYVRVSTADQRQDSQLNELKNYCRMRKWKKLAVYEDKLSGSKATRPHLDRMVSDVRAGRIERVVCYKLDRLGRSVAHLLC
jgi:predicted site-specific integrase-resolvase